jgi:DNA-binding NtrC family response regulator
MKDRLVLIVEEDENIVDALADDLLDYQLEAIMASDLNEAINMVKKFRKNIALILCDAGIEDGNGIALKETMMDENIKIPFILLTEELTDALEEDAERLGVRDVLIKPIDLEVMREIIEEIADVA